VVSEQRRVTQKDIAERAGVNRATVSMALHKHPSIPVSTQARIRKIAVELGYSPDPMLSALASYRNTLRPRNFQGVIAWLVNNVPPFDWSRVSMFQEYYRGASQRASEKGYKLEVFDLQAKGTTPARLAKIFHFRNINGLLLCPQPRPNWKLDFPCEDFACVTFGYSLTSPALHTVASTQFRAMLDIMRRLYGLGYRRIGFAFSFVTDEKADHNFLAGFLVEKYLHDRKLDIPPFNEEQAESVQFKKWFLKYKPDAVVTGNPRILEVIEGAGLQVPGDLGVAITSLPAKTGRLAGIHEDSFHIGEVAVDSLVAMLQSGDRGIPRQPHYTHVPGEWFQGTTVRNLIEEQQAPPKVRKNRLRRPV